MNTKNFKKFIAATTAALTVFASFAAAPSADNSASLFSSSAITVSAKASTKVITESDMDAFFKKWNGKNVNSDDTCPNQCVDYIARYMTDVMGISEARTTMDAKNYYYLFNSTSYLKDNFVMLMNTADFVPKKGDIFVRTTGAHGHVGVVADNNGTTKKFNAYEQNTMGNQDPVKLVTNNYNGMTCFLRYKNIGKALPPSTEKAPVLGTVWVEGDTYIFTQATQMYSDKNGKNKAGTIVKGGKKVIQRFFTANNGKDTIGMIDSKHYVLLKKSNVLSVRAFITTNDPTGVNLREKPDVNSKKLLTIPNGKKLQVTACNTKWARVTYNGKTGFVNLGICKG